MVIYLGSFTNNKNRTRRAHFPRVPTTVDTTPYSGQIRNLGYHNLSTSRILTGEESLVLSLGLGFIPTPPSDKDDTFLESFTIFEKKVRLQKEILSKEPFLSLKDSIIPIKGRTPSTFNPLKASSTIEQYLDEARANLLSSLVNNPLSSLQRQRVNYPSFFKHTINELRSDEDIVIAPSDKNLGLCIIDRLWYLEAANKHLSNTLTYKRITEEPIVQDIYTQLRNILHEADVLFSGNNGKLTTLAGYLLTLENDLSVRLCKFYLLIKIHKSPISSRPICSNVNYITWHASKYLDFVLKPYMVTAPSYIKNSQTLVKLLDIKKFPTTTFLLEADVENLYPSIPIVEGLSRLHSFLVYRRMADSQINLVVRLAEWILQNNFCTFNGTTYLQIQGTAMGTPFAVVYACIFLSSIETEVFARITTRPFYPLFYKRYIDDIVGVFHSGEAASQFINVFNSISPSINLTFIVDEFSVHFLDITLYKGPRFSSDMILDIKLYQKEINKYVYLPPNSFHSKSTFRGIILSELRRYRINCSDDNEFELVKAQFLSRLLDRGHVLANISEIFQTCFNRASLLDSINRTVSATEHPLVFTCTRSPRALKLNLKDCLAYPNYLFNDCHASLIFKGVAPIISYRSTASISSLLVNKL